MALPGRSRGVFEGLAAALGVTPPALVAFVGGGGKTTLMMALARELAQVAPGRVIVTTTTRIFAAQMGLIPAGAALVVGPVQGDKALGVVPEEPGHLLARPGVDYVLVEADGSRMRPVKAPAGHEPVIPPETTLVVPVVGIDALDGPIAQVAHRPERVCALTGLQPQDWLTPAAIAALLVHPQGGLKGVPAGARVVPFINKVETPAQIAAAQEIARLVAGVFGQVVVGAVGTRG